MQSFMGRKGKSSNSTVFQIVFEWGISILFTRSIFLRKEQKLPKCISMSFSLENVHFLKYFASF